jgi:hypothetical protein
MVFIVVQQEGCYSDKEWAIRGVTDTLDIAFTTGFLCIIEEVSTDYTVEFYQDRDAEFAQLRGVSDYHIEEWGESATRKNAWYLGTWRCKKQLDRYLKELVTNKENLPGLLLEWKKTIQETGEIPGVLKEMVLKN